MKYIFDRNLIYTHTLPDMIVMYLNFLNFILLWQPSKMEVKACLLFVFNDGKKSTFVKIVMEI